MKQVTILGATSLIGHFLIPRLLMEGWTVTAISRRPMPNAEPLGNSKVQWLQHDITSSPIDIGTEDTLISLAPIWLLDNYLEKSSEPPKRVIAFSSTSVATKRASSNARERQTAAQLENGERAVRRFAEQQGVGWTILRPTLVYGAGLDNNVSMIARFIQRYRFFPLIGSAEGKRMPVHADDLSQAVCRCLADPATENRLYTLPGGETLSYREMVARVFSAIGLRERFIPLPISVVRAALRGASLLPRFADLTPEMADRTQQDLVFDGSSAIEAFGYAPRSFAPSIDDLLITGGQAG